MLTKLLIALLVVIPAVAESVTEQLRRRCEGFPGAVYLYAKNLETGSTVGIRESEQVRTASTIKLPIMLAVFDAVQRGKAKWTDQLTVTAAEKVAGTGILASEVSDGVKLPLRDVVNLMMVLSDNTATNMILDRFPADKVNVYLDSIGLTSTRSLRKILSLSKPPRGVSAAGALPENKRFGLGVSTARDMVSILEKLEAGAIVSAQASREMLEIMRRCRDDSGIRRLLSKYKVANKTGSLNELRSDVGIVYTGKERIAIAITVDGMPGPDYTLDNKGSLLIADLARIIVDGLSTR